MVNHLCEEPPTEFFTYTIPVLPTTSLLDDRPLNVASNAPSMLIGCLLIARIFTLTSFKLSRLNSAVLQLSHSDMFDCTLVYAIPEICNELFLPLEDSLNVDVFAFRKPFLLKILLL